MTMIDPQQLQIAGTAIVVALAMLMAIAMVDLILGKEQ